MAINFPSSPAGGSTYDYEGVRYTWLDRSPDGYWKVGEPGQLGPATGAEVDTGTDNDKFVTPLSMGESKYVKEESNGVTTLDYNGAGKLSTSNAGVGVTGDVTVSDDIFLSDTSTIFLGAGSDGSITHGGAHLIIDTTVGDMYLRNKGGSGNTNDIFIQVDGSDGNADTVISANANGTNTFAGLHYDGGSRLVTTANGVTVTGNINATGDALVTGTSSAFRLNSDQILQSADGSTIGQYWYSDTTSNYWQSVAQSNGSATNIMVYDRDDSILSLYKETLLTLSQSSKVNAVTRKDYVDGEVATAVPLAGSAVKTGKLVILEDNNTSYANSALELRANAGNVFLGFRTDTTAAALVHVEGEQGLRLVGSGNSEQYKDLACSSVQAGNLVATVGWGGESGDITAGRDIQCDRNTRVEGNLAYGTITPISDKRAKKGIVDAKSEWGFLDEISFKNYKLYKDIFDMEEAPLKVGVIADEVLANPATSELVILHEGEFSKNKNGNPIKNPKTVNYQEMYTKGLVVLKEAKGRIESLEEANEKLEARLSALEKAILG
jgi:hypothetical protein